MRLFLWFSNTVSIFNKFWNLGHLTKFFFLASSPPIGAIPAALIASVLLQLIGRRKTLVLAFSMFLVTFVILGTARLHESYLAIVASRSLTGVAVGFCMPAAQIYVRKSSFFIVVKNHTKWSHCLKIASVVFQFSSMLKRFPAIVKSFSATEKRFPAMVKSFPLWKNNFPL